MKVTKWSIYSGDFAVSEHSNEPTSADTGSVKPAVTEVTPVMAESPAIAPDQELTSPQADAPKVEAKIEPKVEAKVEPKLEPKAPKVEPEAPKVEAKAEAAKPEAPRSTGKVMIMPPGDRSWSGGAAKAQAEPAATKARVPAMAAVIAIAAVAGALGGALITASLGRGGSTEVAAARNVTVEAAIARIDADVLALKAGVEQTSKTGVTQFNKTSDRLDKVEKAQGEPAARLAKLSDEVSKLRAAQAAAVAPVAAPVAAAAPAPVQQVAAVPAAAHTAPKDVTGTVTTPPTAAAPSALTAVPPEVARLPTVEGWVLRDAAKGSALIEGRRGLFEVFAGDNIPGVGRVDAIRKQDGRWVVVTSKGLIVAR
jgi:hypothetical protein